MKKNTIWAVTIILSITLIALILVQSYWIRNALKIKEEQFGQLVTKGLDNVVDEIEQREMVYQVYNEVEPYQNSNQSGSKEDNYKSNRLQRSLYGLEMINQEKDLYRIENLDSLDFDATLEYFNGNFQVNTKSNFIIEKFSKEELLKIDNMDAEFATKLADKRVFVENIVNKLIQVDVKLEERIDKETLNEILGKEFQKMGLDLNYKFCVIGQHHKVVFQSDDYDAETSSKIFRVQLFPNDFFASENYLNIYFPSERRYILRSTGFMSISSILLMIIVFTGFSLSIHIMFKQKRLSRVKNDFVNNMTHELKTPISTISLASQMLKDKSIPKENKNLDNISNIIDDESKRLSYQVEKVLKTALFDQGKIKLKPRELDIHQNIDSVIKNFTLQIKKREGQITKQLKAQNPILKVDEVHFTNILFNLLDNAVKYSPDKPVISISTSDTNRHFELVVEDKGIGIKKADQKRIFDQFYRVSTGNVHDVKGFGLGLNYVKKIVEAHGGVIDLSSEPLKGSAFKIRIPKTNNNGSKED